MQMPDGSLMEFESKLNADLVARIRKEETGKAHPVFSVGEILEIRGGKWKVMNFEGGRMVLEAVPY